MRNVFDSEHKTHQYSDVSGNQFDDQDNDASIPGDERTGRATTIFEGMKLVGQVEGSHDFYLYGGLEGKVNLSEVFKVGKSGFFKGEVKAKKVIIEGTVDGKITADERVEISATGHCRGDVVTPSLQVSDEAYFEGKVTMARSEPDKPEKTKKAKKELHVEVVEEETAKELSGAVVETETTEKSSTD